MVTHRSLCFLGADVGASSDAGEPGWAVPHADVLRLVPVRQQRGGGSSATAALRLQTHGFEKVILLQLPLTEALEAFDGVLGDGALEGLQTAVDVTVDATDVTDPKEATDTTFGQLMQQMVSFSTDERSAFHMCVCVQGKECLVTRVEFNPPANVSTW